MIRFWKADQNSSVCLTSTEVIMKIKIYNDRKIGSREEIKKKCSVREYSRREQK